MLLPKTSNLIPCVLVSSQYNLSRNFSAVLVFFYKVRCNTYAVSFLSTKSIFYLEKSNKVKIPQILTD